MLRLLKEKGDISCLDINSVILQNYDFAISLCNFLTLKKDDCLRRTSEVFSPSDTTKAEAICHLISSASASSGCLNNIRR